MIWNVLRAALFVTGLLAFGLVASNCTMLSLNYASLETDNKPDARPAIDAPDLATWTASRPALRAAFAEHVYGPWPDGLAISFGETRVVQRDFLDGRAVLEETPIIVGDGEGARRFHLATVYPAGAEGAPLIVAQTFSSNCSAIPGVGLTAPGGGVCDPDAKASGLIRLIFGEFIALAPVEQYVERGYAYATFYASEFVPDRDEAAQAALAGLTTDGSPAPTGTLSAWAYGYSAALDLLEADPRIDPARTALFGHSRHGKAALVAAAWDERVDAVFAHQSGFGGAALSRSKTGEGLERVTENYGYWFDPAYAGYADRLDEIPIDQHQLLALIAPRPLLLGNSRRDVWSDPNSTYRAAEAADPVYELYGSDGLDQDGLKDFKPDADLAFYMRSGAHGVGQEDIDAMLDFLDAHFGEAGETTLSAR